MPRLVIALFLVVLCVAGALSVSATASFGPQAAPAASPAAAAGLHQRRVGMARFSGKWEGHTRLLKISRRGRVRESIGDGCCDPVIDLRLRASDPRSGRYGPTLRVRVTVVHVHDPDAFSPSWPAPRVGQVGRLRLRHGVIREPLTKTTYCDRRAGSKGICGA